MQFAEGDQVPRRIADGAVANAVVLLGRLLNDIGTVGLQPHEGGVEIGRGQENPGVSALRHQLEMVRSSNRI